MVSCALDAKVGFEACNVHCLPHVFMGMICKVDKRCLSFVVHGSEACSLLDLLWLKVEFCHVMHRTAGESGESIRDNTRPFDACSITLMYREYDIVVICK